MARELSRQRLSFAVVLKHEQFPTRDELDKLQELCPDVTLIPGAEINIIVDALFKKIGKDYFFHCIVAVDPREKGDYSYVLRSAIENYQYRDGDYPAGFRSSVLDVGLHFREKGALFIPAHLHQAKAPEDSRSVDDLYNDDAFLSFIEHGAFDALEVRQRQTAAFFDGKQVTLENRAIPKATCVCSSDAHHHDHIDSATGLRGSGQSARRSRSSGQLYHYLIASRLTLHHRTIHGLLGCTSAEHSLTNAG